MKQTIVIIALVCLASCASDQSAVHYMDKDIALKEMQIDRFDQVFDFADTVGESDAYDNLVTALMAYRNAKRLSDKEDAYDKYVEAYNEVYTMSMDIIEKRGDE